MTIFSSIPLVKAALTDTLTAAFGDDVAFTYGHPGTAPGIRRCGYIEGTVDWDIEWAALGMQATVEKFTLGFKLVSSFPSATSFKQSTDSVCEMAETATAAIRELLLITGVAIRSPFLVVPGPGGGLHEFFTDDKGAGFASLLDLGIRAQVRNVAP